MVNVLCVDDIEFDQLTAWHAATGIHSGDLFVTNFARFFWLRPVDLESIFCW